MNTQKNHLHVVGIGGIGASALARYYMHLGYSVSGSDGAHSPLLDTLRTEGMTIYIGHTATHVPAYTTLVIYSEAIITKPDLPPAQQIYTNAELAYARDMDIEHISYPVALGRIFDSKKGIAICGSHGKSTTTAMCAITLKRGAHTEATYVASAPGICAIVGTQVPQLDGKNMYVEDSEYMVIEACEYKRSFLQYHPYITVITNIDLDHLDYYRDIEDYISAFQSIVDQTSGYVLVSADCENSAKLHIPESKKIIIHTPNKTVYTSENTPYITYYPRVDEDIDGVVHTSYVEQTMQIPAMHLQVPGQHILHDAHLVYTVARLLQMTDTDIAQRLQSYTGSWRRSEVVGTTAHGNILMSDYGHHPSEIVPTLRALKQKYSDKKLYVVFQPHQYSRTRELLDDFATCWVDADMLVIPDIYFSRDRTEDVAYMTTDRLVRTISTYHPHVVDGKGLKNTADMIRQYDSMYPDSSIILLLGAGDVDGLRGEIL